MFLHAQAIFSDDSDEEADHVITKAENSEKKGQAASAALNRLMAGDFLESLGKELGLEVPADQPVVPNITGTSNQRGDSTNANAGSSKTPALNEELPSFDVRADNQLIEKSVDINGHSVPKNSRKVTNYREDTAPSSVEEEKSRKSSKRRKYSSDSSEEERRRKGSDRRQYNSDSDSDVSSDHRDQSHSSSKKKRRDRESSRSKRHGSRKRSEQRKHRDRDSPGRSSHRTREKR